jgi:hypothetical protein
MNGFLSEFRKKLMNDFLIWEEWCEFVEKEGG